MLRLPVSAVLEKGIADLPSKWTTVVTNIGDMLLIDLHCTLNKETKKKKMKTLSSLSDQSNMHIVWDRTQ